MSAGSSRNFPWPVQTSLPELPVQKQQLIPNGGPSGSSFARQIIADQSEIEAAMTQCQIFSGNAVISCFPTADIIVPQHQWATFVWNSRRPEITQMNEVDIFLFRADSLEQVVALKNVKNPPDQAGFVRALVNDSWWGDNGSKWSGTNVSYPFYWVIIRSDKTLDGSELPQSTFTAVQTTYADSVMFMSSTSAAAAASASSAAALSASMESASRRTQSSSTASVQSSPGSSSFPHWAIAVIVILGFFAAATFFVFTFLLIRKIRRRPSKSNRNSMGSASPMMADVVNSPHSPLLTGAATQQQPPVHLDRASTLSRDHSSEAGAGPFSGADAAIMADAFRKALRKPGFPDLPVEEDSPEAKEERLDRELEQDGRDIRNVRSSRGVKVDNPS